MIGNACRSLVPDPKRPLTHFSVLLNEQLAEDFDDLARNAGVSRAEIFKRAMAAYKLLKDKSARGVRIVAQNKGEADRQLIVL